MNKIYDRRHEVIVSCFSANPEGVSRLKEIIPRICHEETIIPEENLRERFTIFNRPTRNQTIRREIVKIRKLYKFLFSEITNITIKRYTYSLDGEDDDEGRYFDIWLMISSDDFRELPIIPDRGVISGYSNNIYSWFKYWFRQYDNEMAPKMLLRVDENKTKVITKKFNDEEAKEPVTCKICLVNTPKVVLIRCGHSACFSCADKLKDCHMCRKTI